MRVVSLIPSATEIVGLLGATDALVGRSHECDHPPDAGHAEVLTSQRTAYTSPAEVDAAVRDALEQNESLYHLDTDRLRALRPDLIITQDLCKVCSIDLETVRTAAREIHPSPTVLSLNPESLEEVYDDVLRVGEAMDLSDRARVEVVAMRERFHEAADAVNPYTEPPTVAFLEWTDPLFIGGHWTPQLIERAGGAHPLNPTHALDGAGSGAGAQGAHRVAGASVVVTPEQLVASRPEALVICPCGVPLPEVRTEAETLAKRDWYRELPAAQSGRVALVDGNQMFNRPGPRLVDAFRWLAGWLNDTPRLIPEHFPWTPASP